MEKFCVFNSSLGGRSVFAGLVRTTSHNSGAFPFAAKGGRCSFVPISGLIRRVTIMVLRGRIGNVVGYYAKGPVSLTRTMRKFVQSGGLSVALSCKTFPSHPCSSPYVCKSGGGVGRVVRGTWDACCVYPLF